MNSNRLSMVAAALGGAIVALAASQVVAVSRADEAASPAAWVLDEAEGLASARCPTGQMMVGLKKTTSDASMSMDPAAYREIVPLCAAP